MRVNVEIPGRPDIVIDDAVLSPFIAKLQPATPNRTAYAAARIVLHDDYAQVTHTPTAPATPDELAPFIDWDASAAHRRWLGSHGFGIAEAMDTAQRFAIGWPNARALIERCAALDLEHGFVAGAGADGLTDSSTPAALVDEVVEQAAFIDAHGGIAVLLPLPALMHHGADESGFVEVYREIIKQAPGPLILHWLGPQFMPVLDGYFPGDSFQRILALDPDKVIGCKLSLLDSDFEIKIRRACLPRRQVVLTGDDWNFSDLILGSDSIASQEETAPDSRVVNDISFALGDFSHALLGVFDGIAAPAGLALRLLAQGDTESYRAIMHPCETLGRQIFAPPVSGYKAGLAFLAWLDGRQSNPFLANHEQTLRSKEHLLEVAALAANAGLFTNASITTERLRAFAAD